jgi:anti-sigma-K factor RskA
MKEETELKLLAYVDGELSQEEAAEVEALLYENRLAADMVGELRWTGTVMEGNDSSLKVPEGREFYWCKISRSIEFAAQQAERETRIGSSEPLWRRIWAPLAGFAAVALVMAINVSTPEGDNPAGASKETSGAAAAEPVWEDASVYEYYDEKERMSVIWVTSGEENELSTPARENLFRDDEF